MTTSKMSSTRPTDVEDRSGPPARESIQTVLFRDHERLDSLFRSIVDAADCTDVAELRAAWMAFERELEGHLELEEKQVLPRFARSKPDEARVLLGEHAQIRNRLMDMGVDLDLHCLGRDRIQAFADALRAHARRENALFYPWANQYLGLAPDAALADALKADDKTRSGGEEGWWIDADRSRLEFSLRHLVVGQIRGRFARWGGTGRIDVADVERSLVRVWVELASIDTGDRDRDDQVRSSEFFDIARFPRAVFKSTQVQLPERGRPVVAGSLELHGVKADVALEITDDLPWRSDPASPRMSFAIKGRLDRRHFGLRWNQDLDIGGVVVGDEVEIIARLELVRASTAKVSTTS